MNTRRNNKEEEGNEGHRKTGRNPKVRGREEEASQRKEEGAERGWRTEKQRELHGGPGGGEELGKKLVEQE